jgi:hypothetical protein
MSDMKKLLEAMDSMAKAEKKPTGPKFPGYWKGTEPASKSKSKMVGSAQESIIKELDKTAKATSTERKLKEQFESFKDQGVVTEATTKFPLVFGSKDLSSNQLKEYAYQYYKAHNINESFFKMATNISHFNKKKFLESKELSDIAPFIDAIHRLDYQKTIKVGDLFSVLEFEINFAWSEIDVRGFATPKEVVDIKQNSDGTINYIRFSDGDRYPRLVPASYSGRPVTQTAYFDNEKAAKSALSMLLLKVPAGWDVNTDEINNGLNESSNMESANQADAVTMDVPLLIRVMEYAREDAKTDIDLHDVAERLIELSQEGRTLTMQDYDSIMGQMNEIAPVPPTAPGGNAQDPNKQATAPDQQATVNTQKNLSKLKMADPTLNPGIANQALQGIEANPNKTVSGAQLQQTQNLADLVGDALADPQKGSQLATILQQVQQSKKAPQ